MTLSPRQQQVLDILTTRYGGEAKAATETYREIAEAVGWRHWTSARGCLVDLVFKGRVQREGPMSRPRKWIVRASA